MRSRSVRRGIRDGRSYKWDVCDGINDSICVLVRFANLVVGEGMRLIWDCRYLI